MEVGSEKPADLDPKSAESKPADAWIHANVGRAWLNQLPVFTMRVSADDRYYNIKSPGSRFYIPGLDGQTPDEYLAILPPVLQPEENLGKRTRAIFAEVRRTQTQQTFEYLLDGYTQTWLDMTVIPIASDELLVVIHDISARKKIERSLAEERERFALLAQLSADYTYHEIHYPDGRIELKWLNDNFPKFVGFTSDHLKQDASQLVQYIHPDDIPNLYQRLQSLQAGLHTITEYRINAPDGNTYWMTDFARAIKIGADGYLEAYGAAQDITTEKTALEAVQASENRYRTFVDLLAAYAYYIEFLEDDQFRLRWVSEGFETYFGYAPQSNPLHYAEGLVQNVVPEDAAVISARRAAILGGDPGYVSEFRVRTTNGDIRWMRDFIRSEKNPETGQVIAAYGAAQDITEQKLADQALRESQRQTKIISEIVSDFIYQTRYHYQPDGSYTIEIHLSDDRLTSTLGYTIEDFQAMNNDLLRITHPDDLPIVQARRERFKSGEIVVSEFRLRHKDGSTIWVRDYVRGFIDSETGRTSEAFGAMQDITAQKHAEVELADALRARQIITDIISEYIYRLDYHYDDAGNVEVKLHWYSDKLLELTGHTKAEIRSFGGSILPIAHPDDHEKLLERRQKFEQGETQVTEFRLLHKNGDIIWVRDYIRAIFDPQTGRIIQGFGALQNITQQKLAELALRDSELRNQRIAEMTSDFAYRIKVEASPTGDLIQANIVWASERLEQVTGYDLDEFNVVINNIFAITHPDDAELLRQRRKAVLAGEKVSSEFRIYRKTGEMIWVSDIIRGFVNPKTGIVDDAYGAMRDITAQKHAEEALRSSEERYRVISEAVSDYAYHLTIRPREGVEIDWVTDAFQRITGYSIAEINQSGRLLLAVGHPDDKKIIREHMRAVAQGQNHTQEYRIITKTGETRWLRDYTRPILNPDTGDLIACFGAAQDITAQKQAEESLRASEERYRIISEMMSDFAYRIDYLDDGSAIATDISGANERIISYTPTEVARLGGLIGITYPEDRPKVQARNQRVRAGETVVSEFRIITKLGDVRWLRDYIRPIYSPTLKRVVRAYGASQDITQIREAQQQIQTLLSQQIALNELAVALGNVAEIDTIYPKLHQFISQFFRFDRFFVVLYQPEKSTLEAVFAGDQKSAVSPLYSRPLDPSGSHPPSNAILNGQPILTQLAGYPDQLVVPMQASGQVLGLLQLHAYGPGNYNQSTITLLSAVANVAGMALQNARLLQDLQRANSSLTEQVEQRTSQLQKANAELALALKAKDEFLANISHELRTPLTAILGLTEALTERRADDVSQWEQKALATITDSGQHLLTLINDLLDIARLEAGKLSLDIGLVDLADLLVNSQQYVRQQASANQLTLHQQVSFELNKAPPFFGDERRLLQVLINLLNNSVKFTSTAGEVGVDLTADPEYKTLQLAVWDTGIGIPPDELLRMFNPFEQMDSSHTRKQSGTGLGLSLTLSLVEMHGGSIKVETHPQQGSRFIVTLPWRTSMGTATKPPGTPPSGRHVLAILNPYSEPALIREHLHQNKLRLMFTHSLNEALEIADHGLRIEWVLVDARLTDEPAKTILPRLRQHPNLGSLPIVAMTALDIPQEIDALKSAGATAVITKPILSDTFSQVINQLKTSSAEGQQQ